MRLKLSAVKECVRGRRVVLVDDSIVRGTTARRIVALLREAGATEVHLRISAPPFLHPCYYGTDIDSEEHLIACRCSVAQIARELGADSLGYLPTARIGELAGGMGLCAACFDGRYPTPVPSNTAKSRFERKLSEDEGGKGHEPEIHQDARSGQRLPLRARQPPIGQRSATACAPPGFRYVCRTGTSAWGPTA